MDNLAKDAFLARQNGMSYGRYMANKKPAYKTADSAPKGAKTEFVCAVCGKVFYRYDRRFQRFCSQKCKYRDDYIKKKELNGNGKSKNAGDE